MLNSEYKSRLVTTLAITMCLLGLFLRVYFFGINRSLWFDEAKLALNIIERSFLDLIKPLDFDQGAPIGFLLLEKAVVSLLGSSDYTLRIIPLVSGLASILIMYSVSEQYVGKSYKIIPIGLFAFSPKLIHYSSELKQYSTDVLTTLFLLFIASKCLKEKPDPQKLVLLGFLGILVPWISHPSLFVFIGIFITIGLSFTIQRDIYRILWLIGAGTAWGISFALTYFINLRYLESNNTLTSYWSGSFAPMPPWSNLTWLHQALIDMLRDPATLPSDEITLGLLIVGTISFAIRRWQSLLVILNPFLLALIASSFGKYPLSGRLLLFLLPLLFLLITEGVRQVITILLKGNDLLAWFVYIFLAVYFLNWPMNVAYNNLQSPPMGQHIKPVMADISKNHLSTDLIYVYYGAMPAWKFYMSFYRLDKSNYIFGLPNRTEPIKYLEDVENLRGNQRVWFVFSHNCSWCIVNEQEFILEHLNEIGVKRREFLYEGASAYLYDLSQTP